MEPEKPLEEIVENHDLRVLIEHHKVDVSLNPKFIKSLDKTLTQYQETLQAQAKLFASKLKEESYDELTGCYVRKKLGGLLYPQIELSREKGHNLSVIMIDIDHFKPYNDDYGHLQGDLTLKTVGNIIRNIVKSPNSAVRYGGEEFYLILPETDADEAEKIAERVRSTIEKTVFKKHPQVDEMGVEDEKYKHVTVTSGVFTYHSGLDSILGFYETDKSGFDMVDTLINTPDQVLKDGKNRDQRNQVHIAQLE